MEGPRACVLAVLLGACGAAIPAPGVEPQVGRMVDPTFLDDRVDDGELRAYTVAANSSLANALAHGAERLRASALTWCREGRTRLPICARVEREIAALEALARNTAAACERHAAALDRRSRWVGLCAAPPAPARGKRVMVIGASQ